MAVMGQISPSHLQLTCISIPAIRGSMRRRWLLSWSTMRLGTPENPTTCQGGTIVHHKGKVDSELWTNRCTALWAVRASQSHSSAKSGHKAIKLLPWMAALQVGRIPNQRIRHQVKGVRVKQTHYCVRRSWRRWPLTMRSWVKGTLRKSSLRKTHGVAILKTSIWTTRTRWR